jgi:hypothetical protein
VHSTRSACCDLATASKQVREAWPTTGLAGRRTRPASARSTRTARRAPPQHAQSVCHGTTHGGSPVAKPWQGVHRKLPQPTVHSLDTVESPSLKRGSRATEGWNSSAWSMASELNDVEGASPFSWGVALGSGEALGPAYGERGGVRRLGTDEAVEN